MATISAIRSRIATLNIPKEAQAAIEKTKGEIGDLNRERMLSGKLADGSVMPNYSFVSVNVFGYPPGPWRLKNKGDFQAAINVKVNDSSYITSSTDPKTERIKRMLAKKGLNEDALFGLDKEGKQEYIKDLRPVFVGQIREKLRL